MAVLINRSLYAFQDGHPCTVDRNTVITEIPQSNLLTDNFNLIVEMCMSSPKPTLYGYLPLLYPLNLQHRCDTHISISNDNSFLKLIFLVHPIDDLLSFLIDYELLILRILNLILILPFARHSRYWT